MDNKGWWMMLMVNAGANECEGRIFRWHSFLQAYNVKQGLLQGRAHSIDYLHDLR